MLIDKGVGIHYFKDLLETAGAYIDFIKLGFGTAALYPVSVLQNKLQLAREYKVDIYPRWYFFRGSFSA